MIDKAKTYKTRGGQDVRIYATDCGQLYSVHGAIKRDDGIWRQSSWTAIGNRFFSEKSPDDLIEVKPRIVREVWVNVYQDRVSDAHISKEEADNWRKSGAIACVKLTIDCEEGEGL